MAWNELARFRKGKVWQDSLDPAKRALTSFAGLQVHYQAAPGVGAFDQACNLTPVRVNNAQFDGWVVNANSWHYALGRDLANHGAEDGWIGFGGRKAQHWFKYRLERVGYLHWPTRTWTGVGGLASYTRAGNLTRTPITRDLLPGQGDVYTLGQYAEWRNVFTSPGGGEGWLAWKAGGGRLKQEIRANQVARDAIAAAYPGGPTNETYFGYALRLDFTDIPKMLKGNVQVGFDDDFEDNSEFVIFANAADELLAYMPLDSVWVEDAGGVAITEEIPLLKRLYFDGAAHWLVVGQRVDLLAGLPSGTIVFDPTLDDQVGASDEDAAERDDGTNYSSTAGTITMRASASAATRGNGGFYFDMPSGPTNGDTIDVCYATFFAQNTTVDDPDADLLFNDVDAAADFTSEADVTSRARTSASVSYIDTGVGAGAVNTPSIVSPLQEVIDRGGYASGNAVCLLGDGHAVAGGVWTVDSYDGDPGSAAALHVEWTAGGAAGQPFTQRHIGIPTARRDRPGGWN